MGFEAFAGLESIIYRLQSPCRVIELGEFEPIERTEWVPDAHAHRHLRTWDIPPAGDAVTGRQLLMWNNDVEISLCRPTEPMDGFFRNGERDEVVFVHEGDGVVETVFGDVSYKDGDYIVLPRGTTYRFVPQGEQRYLVFETPGLITIPKRYRNEHGQLMEHAPYYHRDIHPPTELRTHRERGEFVVKVRVRNGIEVGSITLHPSGLPHGPQPGLAEKSLGMTETHEYAVMCDTFHPLRLTSLAGDLDDGKYMYTWAEDTASSNTRTPDEDPAGITSHL